METAILLGLIGIGYLQKESNRNEAHPEISADLNLPKHNSVYDQNNFDESKKTEKTLSRGKFKNFRLNKIIKTNIVKKIFTLKLFQVSKEILFIFFEISVESLRL